MPEHIKNSNKDELCDYVWNYRIKSLLEEYLRGEDDIEDKIEAKGIGNEITLPTDILNKEEAYKHLLYLSNKVGKRLRDEDKYAYTIVVIIKDNEFKRYSHQKKLVNSINTDKDIYENSKIVFNELYKNQKIRLIGIRLDKLVTKNNYQYSLFEEVNDNKDNEQLNKVVDKINDKYGKKIIKNAGLLNKTIEK